MPGQRIIYYILGAFLTGNFLLIYIQYNSTKNINTLINSNDKVISEMKVRNNLRELERNITSIEGKISGTLYTKDSSHLEGLGQKIMEVQHDIDNLQKISDDDTSVKYIDVLDPLVHKKLLFGKEVLDTLYMTGKEAAENLTSSPEAKQLNDSIKQVTHIIENSRQKLLSNTILSINKSGRTALNAGISLIVFVLLSGAVLFWFIIFVIRKQNQLIIQLHATDKKVREAVQVKEKFLANMSHEIRTPINAILGFTNLLQRKNLDEESMEYIHSMEMSGNNLLTIINDILDLSKIEAGMMRIESAPFSIRNVLHSVEEMFRSKIKEKNLQFVVDIDKTIPDILEGDSIRLTQILVNLVSNSLKFTAKGSINIHITNEGIVDNTLTTGIEIKDTGIGIEKEILEKIFDRFQQAEDSVTRKYGGTGLGLSIVQELVSLQNGKIRVESEPGNGTTFHVMMPFVISTIENIDALPREKIAYSVPDLTGFSILIAEDNKINQSLLQHLFQQWKLNFDMVENGIAAIQKIENNNYHLVLMDIQMPEMDGYTATKKIRNILKSDIPIIAMTAHALPGEREKCLSYGMNEYISKPIKEEELLRLIIQFTREKNEKADINAAKPTNGSAYHYINLNYMRDVSLGNTDYEKIITEQFIEIIPNDLLSIQQAWKDKDINTLRHLVHNLKTSVSVMGLNEALQDTLDVLEYEDLDEARFKKLFSFLESVCKASLEESKIFYSTL